MDDIVYRVCATGILQAIIGTLFVFVCVRLDIEPPYFLKVLSVTCIYLGLAMTIISLFCIVWI